MKGAGTVTAARDLVKGFFGNAASFVTTEGDEQ